MMCSSTGIAPGDVKLKTLMMMPLLSAGGVSLTAIARDGSDKLMSTVVLAVVAVAARRRRRRRLLPHDLTDSDITGEFTDDEELPRNRLLLDINVCTKQRQLLIS